MDRPLGAMTAMPNPSLDTQHGPVSPCSISVLAGPGVAVWSTPASVGETLTKCELCLAPDQPAVIGRYEGQDIEYLDPAYRPTQILPGTGKNILHSDGHGSDNYVSRGHFMLRANAAGIILLNGVPRRGGGIRPPTNGTLLVAPEHRALAPGEEYLIASGTMIVIRLPNRTEVQIDAR